jgi:hypothetical protein
VIAVSQKVSQPKRRAHRSGTVVSLRKDGRTIWAARLLLKDGSRKQIRCPVGFTRAQAERDAQKWQALEDASHALYNAKARALGKIVEGESADAWFARMLPLREKSKGVVDTAELESYWRNWIAPVLGKTAICCAHEGFGRRRSKRTHSFEDCCEHLVNLQSGLQDCVF